MEEIIFLSCLLSAEEEEHKAKKEKNIDSQLLPMLLYSEICCPMKFHVFISYARRN